MRAELCGTRTILRDLRPATPWAPRPLPSDSIATGGGAVVALVQTAATLLSGDDCAIELELGPGAALTMIETGATIAHHVRDGPPARLRVRIALGAGARLEWLARPLVLAAGCDLRRTTTVELAAGARALLRETVVLGRSGEQPGRLDATLRASHTGRALLHERLDTAAPRLLRSPVVAADATTLDAVLLLGARGADLPGSTQLSGPGTLWRALHPRGADPDGPALAVARAWSG
ncbi:MAG TPA: urease accessory protein UreD [Conexibacter sp.]|nr:urease accessory protein UreD [Conexibacter sp.]